MIEYHLYILMLRNNLYSKKILQGDRVEHPDFIREINLKLTTSSILRIN